MKEFPPTAHNSARKGEIAQTVLMPGDPLRAKFIAESYLQDIQLVSEVRNMYCFTGKYQGKPISVMGSGMGPASIGIYSFELYNYYDVERIIRVGSAGSLQSNLHLRDIVIVLAASTDSNYLSQYHLDGNVALCADFELAEKAASYARLHHIPHAVGPVLSSEIFYNADTKVFDRWRDIGMLAAEMESAILYANAQAAKKKALAICTISDLIYFDENCSNEERQSSFTDMIEMALSLVE